MITLLSGFFSCILWGFIGAALFIGLLWLLCACLDLRLSIKAAVVAALCAIGVFWESAQIKGALHARSYVEDAVSLFDTVSTLPAAGNGFSSIMGMLADKAGKANADSDMLSDEEAEQIPEEMQKQIAEAMMKQVPDEMKKQIAEATMKQIPDEVMDKLPDDVKGQIEAAVNGQFSEIKSEQLPEETQKQIAEAAMKQIPEEMKGLTDIAENFGISSTGNVRQMVKSIDDEITSFLWARVLWLIGIVLVGAVAFAFLCDRGMRYSSCDFDDIDPELY